MAGVVGFARRLELGGVAGRTTASVTMSTTIGDAIRANLRAHLRAHLRATSSPTGNTVGLIADGPAAYDRGAGNRVRGSCGHDVLSGRE